VRPLHFNVAGRRSNYNGDHHEISHHENPYDQDNNYYPDHRHQYADVHNHRYGDKHVNDSFDDYPHHDCVLVARRNNPEHKHHVDRHKDFRNNDFYNSDCDYRHQEFHYTNTVFDHAVDYDAHYYVRHNDARRESTDLHNDHAALTIISEDPQSAIYN